jgi:hypothetical protein
VRTFGDSRGNLNDKDLVMRTICAIAVLVAATAGCASGSSAAGEASAGQTAGVSAPRAQAIVPLADHHQHLWSPASALQATDPLPAVEVPAGIAALLQKRAELWRDLEALEALYTPDAIASGLEMPNVVLGGRRSARAVGWIGGNLYEPYTLTPVSFRSYGDAARIGGYYTQRTRGRNLGLFHMIVERGSDGTWRIASEVPVFPRRGPLEPLDAAGLIAHLETAGIRKAVVLSLAYAFDGLLPPAGDDYTAVRAENDWVAEQVMRYPDRLVGFCSFNPVRDHALAELERCAANPAFKGVKLHFGTSPVDLDNPEHVARTRRVFQAANRLRLPIQVHLSASPEWGARRRRPSWTSWWWPPPTCRWSWRTCGEARATRTRRSPCWRMPWRRDTRRGGTCTSTWPRRRKSCGGARRRCRRWPATCGASG